MRALRNQLLVLLAALTVLLGTNAWAGQHYFCRMSGRVQATCCCKGSERDQHRTGVGVEASDCCERLSAQAPTPAATGFRADDTAPVLAFVATISEPVYVPLRAEALEHRLRPGRGPPEPRVPLFIAHCSLLS